VLRKLIVALVAVGSASPAFAADPASIQERAPVTPTANFAAQVAFGDMFEIESSKLALERASSPEVKGFAQRMVDDHSAAAVHFKEAVLQAQLPMPPDKVDARRLTILEELAEKRGEDFDKSYIETQFKAHMEAVALFRGYAQGGEDARLRAFASQTLPTLESHLAQVSKMRSAR
jgi:putative membrane protein